jgi:3-keto-L-gulonate-6-phosphate decarboxylase
MKTIFLSLLSLSLAAGSAFASDHSTEKKSLHAANSSAVINLTEENLRLRHQVDLLENQTAELQSAIAYQSMMINMLGHLHNAKDKEAQEEREAENAYNKMMSNLLIVLREKQ